MATKLTLNLRTVSTDDRNAALDATLHRLLTKKETSVMAGATGRPQAFVKMRGVWSATPRYATSADAVIPALEASPRPVNECSFESGAETWTVACTHSEPATAEAFALAATIALLRARGVDVMI